MNKVFTAAAIDECYTKKGKNQKVLYFTAGLNGDINDLKIADKICLSKDKVDESYVIEALKDRRYSFFQFNPGQLNGISNEKKMALVLGSLFLREPVGKSLTLYIDGLLLPQGPKEHIKNVLKKSTGLEKSLIHIHDGAQLDQRMPLANLAHQCARVFSDSPLLTFGNPPGKKHLAIKEFSKILGL